VYALDLLVDMERTPGNYYPANGEVHMNPNGYKFAAEKIFEVIQREGLLGAAPGVDRAAAGSAASQPPRR
jgi:hypothetical protein